MIGRIVDNIGNRLLRPPIGGLGSVFLHGSRTQKRVAITYDDGPNDPSTVDILDVLKSYDVKATFFCVGVNARMNPAIVQRAYAEGHVIGNHSMEHSRKAGLTLGNHAHIDDCSAALTEILGVRPRLYRAPWGWLTPWETRRLKDRDFSIIGWDVYTYDWETPPPAGMQIAEQIERDSTAGSVILLHDGIPGIAGAERPETTAATENAILKLRAAGYEFVTVAELFGLEPYFAAATAGATAVCP